jgi:hypothetical protein
MQQSKRAPITGRPFMSLPTFPSRRTRAKGFTRAGSCQVRPSGLVESRSAGGRWRTSETVAASPEGREGDLRGLLQQGDCLASCSVDELDEAFPADAMPLRAAREAEHRKPMSASVQAPHRRRAAVNESNTDRRKKRGRDG